LLAQWMNLGFIHGVMNTDNMTISGETIDYGPCAFLEAYDPDAVFSSIDRGGRYAFGNQPLIARWNLARLAEALLPLMADADDTPAAERAVAEVTAVIDAFPAWYAAALLRGQRGKFGLQHATPADDVADSALADDWLALLHTQSADFTLAWRALADAAEGNEAPLRLLLPDAGALDPWLSRWRARCAADDHHTAPSEAHDGAGPGPARAAHMRQASPWLIPRNHRVEEALAAASDHGDMAPFHRLLSALQTPYRHDEAHAELAEPAPAAVTACYKTFCGT
jgi:uncharacterized protein YdiU (UPF0061 family)